MTYRDFFFWLQGFLEDADQLTESDIAKIQGTIGIVIKTQPRDDVPKSSK